MVVTARTDFRDLELHVRKHDFKLQALHPRLFFDMPAIFGVTRGTVYGLTRLCVVLLAVGFAGRPAYAQDPSEQLVHWAYASYFGTGWYSVRNSLSVFALRAAPRWHWGEPGIDDEGNRDIGIELRLPVSFSLQKFNLDELGELFDIDNFTTLSVTPGVEVEIPVTRSWSLKPLAYAGWGTELSGPESAWIYWGGLKSQLRLGGGEGFEWTLVNSVEYIGYTPNDGSSNDAVPIMAGLELEHALGGVRLGGEPVYLDWHATYTAYLDNLKFLIRDVPVEKVGDTWEVGLAFSKGKRALKFWRFEFDRLGLAYRFSSGGDFQGISLVFRSVFDS